MQIRFEQVKTSEDIKLLADIASQIWNEYWPHLIGQDQTDYMVENFQSVRAISADISNNAYEYWFLYKENELIGYTGGHNEDDTNRFFISKIYLFNKHRGKGYIKQIIDFYSKLCKQRGFSAMYLTVNKYNKSGIHAYIKTGFAIIESVETDIGCDFIMDDYVMQKDV